MDCALKVRKYRRWGKQTRSWVQRKKASEIELTRPVEFILRIYLNIENMESIAFPLPPQSDSIASALRKHRYTFFTWSFRFFYRNHQLSMLFDTCICIVLLCALFECYFVRVRDFSARFSERAFKLQTLHCGQKAYAISYLCSFMCSLVVVVDVVARRSSSSLLLIF